MEHKIESNCLKKEQTISKTKLKDASFDRKGEKFQSELAQVKGLDAK